MNALPRDWSEMALHILTCNLKWELNILGAWTMLTAMRASDAACFCRQRRFCLPPRKRLETAGHKIATRKVVAILERSSADEGTSMYLVRNSCGK